ncbi:Hypothetical predicted protein [Olea europaea subsp. europaea]|uniref:Uncharacterized protein n=1 Tax=Olea europaea subsp. europaea TaxID=158383 RepID=A0A8S0TTC4_OLEEU|nr:Hypothetical predicted protein [Olea europaea subsp. europaea]
MVEWGVGDSTPLPKSDFEICRSRIQCPLLKKMTVREALNSALDEEMFIDPKVFLMGEEVGEY